MKSTATILTLALCLLPGFLSSASADVNIPGMGSGAYDVPSVGGPGNAVEKAPICDNRARPKITKVTPDPMKPGDKITITGENFGKKECFQTVSIGSDSAQVKFQHVNETTVEATVPDVKPGLSRVNVVTTGGSSQAIVQIQAK